MNTRRTEVADGRRGAAVRWHGQRAGEVCWVMWLGLALAAGGFSEGRADETVRPVSPVASPATLTSVAAASGPTTNQPSSTTVPLGDPVMVQPAVEVLGEMASRDRSDLINRGTQEALDERTKDSLRPLTVEEAGSPLRQVARDRSLRALADLFDPFAPLPKHYRDAAPAFDEQHRLEQDLPSSLRSNGGVTRPRTAIDPTTHEYGWTLFRMSSKAEKDREDRIRERRKWR